MGLSARGRDSARASNYSARSTGVTTPPNVGSYERHGSLRASSIVHPLCGAMVRSLLILPIVVALVPACTDRSFAQDPDGSYASGSGDTNESGGRMDCAAEPKPAWDELPEPGPEECTPLISEHEFVPVRVRITNGGHDPSSSPIQCHVQENT